ncbi:Gamma-L-glutamyl-butirosin B gamma-glutamyl cyclotransferase [Caulifigura coniformis]|uniref:Gamma-glutamylcyclotransferase family protein n=1 Tax=Caulifigura coniformis TaxID=2527983 RepID=A0A517SJ18_9PLAN|nr:gamma-glutamylcyclotransferase family protein [Caulifigura coniformis]QDT56128.1 Gamma-L-glutamyl-butirosin B gamma-glutamyl cyclotransferase [Caulifigura coniformis]
MPLVFVYGTLKRGDCRHRFMAGSRFLGIATTAPGFRLYNLGEYPALVEDNSGGQIEGEVYEVSPAILEVLDEVEGVADSLYVRKRLPLMTPFAESAVEAYLYEGDIRGKRELQRRWDVPLRPPG